MKFRLFDNHLRIRFTRGEVASLAAGSAIEQVMWFSPNSCLVTRVQPTPDAAVCHAAFSDGCLVVQLPMQEVQDWANTDRVGIMATQQVGEIPPLTILIEKDFECLHKEDEQTPDSYPNPHAT